MRKIYSTQNSNKASIKTDDSLGTLSYKTDMVDSPGTLSWKNARYQLVREMFWAWGVHNPNFGVSQQADATTFEKRIKAAANLLAKAVDGILANGDKRVVLGELKNQSDSLRPMPQWMLQAFYDIGHRSNDPAVKQLLLEKLESIHKSVGEPTPDKRGSGPWANWDDLEYLIDLYQGKAAAEFPDRSIITDWATSS